MSHGHHKMFIPLGIHSTICSYHLESIPRYAHTTKNPYHEIFIPLGIPTTICSFHQKSIPQDVPNNLYFLYHSALQLGPSHETRQAKVQAIRSINWQAFDRRPSSTGQEVCMCMCMCMCMYVYVNWKRKKKRLLRLSLRYVYTDKVWRTRCGIVNMMDNPSTYWQEQQID